MLEGNSASGATGQHRFCAPLGPPQSDMGSLWRPRTATWYEFCERSALVLGFILDLDKGCRSGKSE